MKERKKRSVIWQLPKDEFAKIVKESSSFGEILRKVNGVFGGGAYAAIKSRCEKDGIDLSHIPTGIDSNRGRKGFGPEPIPLKDSLIEHSTYQRVRLKERLIEDGILEEKCLICGLGPEWNGQRLVLQIDHVNGVSDDNRIENLRILCPNCHTQTLNFAGRNLRTEKFNRECLQCGAAANNTELCQTCFLASRKGISKIKNRKIKDRPSKEVVKQEVEDLGFVAVGKKYGVSDNAVRKWIK